MRENKIELSIITPERVVYHDFCDYVSIPGTEGILGVYRRHTPLFTQIVQGEVKIRQGQDVLSLAVMGGFVEVEKDQVVILADSALRSDDLDEEKIREAKAKAEEKLRQRLSKQEYVAIEAQLRQILLDLKVAEKKKRSLTKIEPPSSV